MNILILNGPNLNLLGIREPEIYGTKTFETYFKELVDIYPKAQLEYFQSNHEGALIDKIHEYGFNSNGIVFNPGAYTHTSIALADAIKGVKTPVIEVHISDIKKREAYRQISFVKEVCVKSIMGHGLKGYNMAIDFLLSEKQS